jgi:hypothetical protein
MAGPRPTRGLRRTGGLRQSAAALADPINQEHAEHPEAFDPVATNPALARGRRATPSLAHSSGMRPLERLDVELLHPQHRLRDSPRSPGTGIARLRPGEYLLDSEDGNASVDGVANLAGPGSLSLPGNAQFFGSPSGAFLSD